MWGLLSPDVSASVVGCVRKGKRACMERKCCGFIACFSTFIGFGCAVACVVIPLSAKVALDSNICGPILPKMKKAKATMKALENSFAQWNV